MAVRALLDEPAFAGTWSNYRFPGSGITVVSVIEIEVSGLFVLKPQLADGGKKGPWPTAVLTREMGEGPSPRGA